MADKKLAKGSIYMIRRVTGKTDFGRTKPCCKWSSTLLDLPVQLCLRHERIYTLSPQYSYTYNGTVMPMFVQW